MIYRIFPLKDTWITNIQALFDTPQTGSNFGASEILEVFKRTETNGTSSIGRILTQFDESFIGYLTASGQVPSTGVSYHLVMRDAQHKGTLPTSYDLQVHPVSSSWDEGTGLDEETFFDHGYANWEKPKSNLYWNSFGGDFLPSSSVSFHLDGGHEDLDVNVTSFVGQWLSGTLQNNGLLVRVSSTLESDGSDYYVKKFHSKDTNFLDRRPCLELRWDDSAFTGTLMTASDPGPYYTTISNLKNQYTLDEVVQLRLFVRPVNYNPAVVLTASSGQSGVAVTRGYYKITNDRTDEVVIPFGTGSYTGGTDYTRLSYDDSGNYFKFFMSSLSPGNVYRIVFLFDIDGQKQVVDQSLKFRIV